MAFLERTNPASKSAKPASIKKIRAAHNATQTVLIANICSLNKLVVSSIGFSFFINIVN